ncbi:MAG TPA: 50S ribosomal protein L11 methyltransferase [Gemmatimonadaceae bacterium]|nr:50S ribosomal protein L11 methyltransferase [Gemmatimonadaceae bacterium]
MTYARLAVTPSDPARREAVTAALFAAGAEGVLEEGAALITVFEARAAADLAATAARAADERATATVEAYDPGDWTDAWRRGVRPQTVGRLIITPPWADEARAPNAIIIEPAMGFGTGEHESTRLALRLLQEVVRAGDSVIDAGCGSGVLAIAAARLGAARAVGIEIDPLAISNAEENVQRNHAGDRVSILEGDAATLIPLLAPVHVIAANIIATVLLELLQVFGDSLTENGRLVVGGILRSEAEAFTREARLRGWTIETDASEGEWWSAVLKPVRT